MFAHLDVTDSDTNKDVNYKIRLFKSIFQSKKMIFEYVEIINKI